MAIRKVIKGELNPNTSTKRLKNIAKMGGYDPDFKQEPGFGKESIGEFHRENNFKANNGNRPASKTRRTALKNVAKHRYA